MQIKNSDTLTLEISKNEATDFSQLGQDHSKNGSVRDKLICGICDLPMHSRETTASDLTTSKYKDNHHDTN